MSEEQPHAHSAVGRLPKPTAWAHDALQSVLRPGDHVLDATVGNGHDTVFLARAVAPSGHVYGFDIQAEALQSARALLRRSGISDPLVSLFHGSHATLTQHLPPNLPKAGLRAVTFNLGYWPGGDKTVTTLSTTTLVALDAARSLLSVGGLLSVVAYPGHPAGMEEARSVTDWMQALSAGGFEVQHLRSLGRQRPPPELWLALRLR